MATHSSGFGHRRVTALLRAALLASAFACTPVFAGPAEDVDAQAAAIQALLDAGRPADGEALARDAARLAETALGSEAAGTANIYRLLGDTLFDQKRFADAEPFFRKALDIRARVLGENHADTARSAGDLAVTLKSLERYDESETLYRRALAIRQAVFGPDHAEVARSWFRLARLFDAKGDYVTAAATMAEAIAVGTKAFGPSDATVIVWMGERAAQLHDAGDSAAAEPAYRAAIAAGETAFAADDIDLATFRQGLATLLRQTERPAEAAALYRLVLPVREAALGANDRGTGATLDGLARSLEMTGAFAEALPLYQRLAALREADGGTALADTLARIGNAQLRLDRAADAEATFRRELAIREQVEGPESAGVANAARWIARAAQSLDRDAEAELFHRRALAISEKVGGPDNVLTGFDLLGLGLLYSGQQRFAEAEPLLDRALKILGGTHSGTAARNALSFLKFASGEKDEAVALAETSLSEIVAAGEADTAAGADFKLSLAQMLLDTGDLARAEVLATDAAATYARHLPEGRAILRAQSLVGSIRLEQGRTTDAAAIYQSVLDELRARHGEDSTDLQPALADLARAKFASGDFSGAAALFEQSAALIERLASIDADVAFGARTGEVEDVALGRAGVFDFLVKSYDRLEESGTAGQAEKAFLAAQRVIQSEAAKALGQMASRQAAGTGPLADLARERQDLVELWRTLDRRLTDARTSASRDAAAEADLSARLADADRRIREIDATLAADFPDFAELQNPHVSTFADVQASLRDDEVLLFFADTTRLGDAGFETYLWAVPKEGEPVWVRLARSTGELSGAVRALRNLMGVGGETRGAAKLGAPDGDRTDQVLEAAYQLYTATLGPVAGLIEGRKLVIVPSKKLANLPFHLLVSEKPSPGGEDRYRDAHWVALDHAITVLPSVASLEADAVAADGVTDRVPYLGFANPLLVGRSGEDRRAFERTECAPGQLQPVLTAAAVPDIEALFRGATADVDAVRGLDPLPETTDEACAIAAILGAGEESLRLGAAATEAEVKAMSDTAELTRPRILHFATHGLVSGELNGLAEPAIVLTPPAEASALDDGLLTASEVALLRLDADWVILSACNTASGDGGGEALSGLARAFFYAGARSLMVSHWPVNSDAAVSLATGAADVVAANPTFSRAEALQIAMIAEIAKGGRHADPANWAPFIQVGR
ncbi:MAG: tetratricopeptide repeat protein [Rhizobiaceae bacterium]|nr:tetratricopeptide repeat protein [Rhizobiaceae bacterium]